MYLGQAASTPYAPASPPVTPATQPQPAWWQQLIGLGTGIVGLINQNKLAQLNIDRAKQGLSPINLNQVPGAVPTAQVQIDAGGNLQKMLLYTGAGVAAIFIANSMMGGRRRRR